jgi:hypothetical protein
LTNDTLAAADSLEGACGTPEQQNYMQGFTYAPNRQLIFNGDFFKEFPSTATPAKNLMWDTVMLETFAQSRSRASTVITLVADWANHYSTAASYLRLNGILPPRAQPGR